MVGATSQIRSSLFFLVTVRFLKNAYARSGSIAAQIITVCLHESLILRAVGWELGSLSASLCWSLISRVVSAVISYSSLHRSELLCSVDNNLTAPSTA